MADNRKYLETLEPFAGLWVRTANTLRRAGYKSREEVWSDISDGTLRPYISVPGYGSKTDIEVVTWLFRNGEIPFALAKQHLENVYGVYAHGILMALIKGTIPFKKRNPVRA